jgi:hypothetical protein
LRIDPSLHSSSFSESIATFVHLCCLCLRRNHGFDASFNISHAKNRFKRNG